MRKKTNWEFYIILPVIVILVTITVLMWKVQDFAEQISVSRNEFIGSEIINTIKDTAGETIFTLVGVQALLSNEEIVDIKLFKEYVDKVLQREDYILDLYWIDQNNKIKSYCKGEKVIGSEGPVEKQIASGTPIKNLIGTGVIKNIDTVRYSGNPVVSSPYYNSKKEEVINIVLPIFKNNILTGHIVAIRELSSSKESLKKYLEEYNYQAAIRTKIGRINLTDDFEEFYRKNKVKSTIDFNLRGEKWEIILIEERNNLIIFKASIMFAGITMSIIIVLLLISLNTEKNRLKILAEREKNFVSLVSHQLRLPLTKIRWVSEDILNEDYSMKEHRRLVKEILNSVINAIKLINNLLNVSRIERDVIAIDKEDVDLKDFIEETLSPFNSPSTNKNRKIEVQKIEDVIVNIDRQKASEAIRNIVDNAIKYGSRKEGVMINFKNINNKFIDINITNFGKTLSKDEKENIFKKDLNHSNKKNMGDGTGLGLYLSKKFIELINGEISLKSKAGKTTFTIRIPIST